MVSGRKRVVGSGRQHFGSFAPSVIFAPQISLHPPFNSLVEASFPESVKKCLGAAYVIIQQVKLKRAQGGCLGTKSR